MGYRSSSGRWPLHVTRRGPSRGSDHGSLALIDALCRTVGWRPRRPRVGGHFADLGLVGSIHIEARGLADAPVARGSAASSAPGASPDPCRRGTCADPSIAFDSETATPRRSDRVRLNEPDHPHDAEIPSQMVLRRRTPRLGNRCLTLDGDDVAGQVKRLVRPVALFVPHLGSDRLDWPHAGGHLGLALGGTGRRWVASHSERGGRSCA